MLFSLMNNPPMFLSAQFVFVTVGGGVSVNIRFHFSWDLNLGVEFLHSLVFIFRCTRQHNDETFIPLTK